MSEDKSFLEKVGLKPIHVILIVMLAFGGAGSSAIVAKYLGVDVNDVQAEIVTHAEKHDKVIEAKMISRFDSIARAYIENDLATKTLAEAIQVDAEKLGDLADYGFAIMEKDSANEVWKSRVDAALELTAVGCGGHYRKGMDTYYRHCNPRYGDLLVKHGQPADRPDIVMCAYSMTPDAYSIVFPKLMPIKYGDRSVIRTHGN